MMNNVITNVSLATQCNRINTRKRADCMNCKSFVFKDNFLSFYQTKILLINC